METGEISELHVPWLTRVRTYRKIRAKNLFFGTGFSETRPSIPEYFSKLGRKGHSGVSKSVISAIEEVGSHTGDAVIFRNAFKVPLLFRKGRRQHIIAHPDCDDYVEYAAYAAMAYFGAAGYCPLPEYFDSAPRFCVNTKGVEIGAENSLYYQHKLPNEPETVNPHKPFGPALFGLNKANMLDGICPDIVAFLVADKTDDLRQIGPFILGIDEIRKELDEDTLRELMNEQYKIDPDVAITKSRKHGFGGVTNINVIGERGSAEQPDGRRYFRYKTHKTERVIGDDGSIDRLDTAIDNVYRRKTRLDLNRGDILIVNNRRVATKWSRRSLIKQLIGKPVEYNLKPGDRTIIRMSFMYPEELH